LCLETSLILCAHSSLSSDPTMTVFPPGTSCKASATPDSPETRTGTPQEMASRQTNPNPSVLTEDVDELNPFTSCSSYDEACWSSKFSAMTNHNVRMQKLWRWNFQTVEGFWRSWNSLSGD
ncbi:unnamed protein product, partial [Pocillopora meandrina]